MNFRETYLTNLSEVVGNIIKKETLSQQDIQMIALFQSEIKRYEKVPKFDKFMNNVNMVFKFLDNRISTNNAEPVSDTTKTIENINKEEDNGI